MSNGRMKGDEGGGRAMKQKQGKQIASFQKMKKK